MPDKINKRLVLVDDEEMVISSIKNFLLLETEYEVSSFTSPAEALKYLKETPVSLVISDFLMPEINGIEFLKEVKSLYPQATTILLTGYADKENAIKAINELGIYKYIEKPWDNEDLKITIDNAFERTDLIIALEKKVNELDKAQKELKKHNEHLEEIVEERTRAIAFIVAELKAIIGSSADGILTLDKNYTVLSANQAIEKLKGNKLKTIINSSITNLIKANNPININKTLEKSYIDRDCFIYNDKYGKNIPVEVSYAPILADLPETEHNYVVVVRDITAQKESERLREDFIATLTHDLRTPLLAAIQTLSFFLDGTLGELPDKQVKLLSTMKTSNMDMLGLVNALLEVYKYESGELSLIKDHFSIDDLINSCVNEVKSLLEKKNLSITTNCPETIQKIYADKKEIRRVLANFIGNAINYTPTNGFITVQAEFIDNYFNVKVIDTGRGIPPGDLNKLFQRFSQGTSKQRSTGTGLGLYLSRQIIEAHGGKVWAESIEQKGSTFAFSLPINE